MFCILVLGSLSELILSVGVDNVFELNITREEVNLHLCICINCVGMGAKMLCFLTART